MNEKRLGGELAAPYVKVPGEEAASGGKVRPEKYDWRVDDLEGFLSAGIAARRTNPGYRSYAQNVNAHENKWPSEPGKASSLMAIRFGSRLLGFGALRVLFGHGPSLGNAERDGKGE